MLTRLVVSILAEPPKTTTTDCEGSHTIVLVCVFVAPRQETVSVILVYRVENHETTSTKLLVSWGSVSLVFIILYTVWQLPLYLEPHREHCFLTTLRVLSRSSSSSSCFASACSPTRCSWVTSTQCSFAQMVRKTSICFVTNELHLQIFIKNR